MVELDYTDGTDDALVAMTLLCKDHEVLRYLYDRELHAPIRILEVIDERYAPLALHAPEAQGAITRGRLTQWWADRSIPVTRDNVRAVIEGLSVEATVELLEQADGLSLSDRYWVRRADDTRSWAQVNFYDNDFGDTLGLITLGQSSWGVLDRNPNSSLGGDLRKKWAIGQHGERLLIKAGRGQIQQEPYNEVVATALYRRVAFPGGFVPYTLVAEHGSVYSRCPNMLGDDEELVTAWDIRRFAKKANNENWCQFYLRWAKDAGVAGVRDSVSAMVVCDYILANHDRHWNNFGLIRNAETREFVRPAPVFDTGNSLWCSTALLETPADLRYSALPFMPDCTEPERQLGLFDDYRWLDPTVLDGFADEAAEILATNPAMPENRIERIHREVTRRLEVVRRLVRR